MLEYYYEKQYKIYKLHGKLHHRIVLYKHNFYSHIKVEHPEMSIAKIISILADPDYIYKTSDNNKDWYYEKIIGSNYRVVISDYKTHVKNVVTAYELKNNIELDIKHSVCVYNKTTSIPDKQGQEDDFEYFLELFKVDAD